MIDFLVGLGAGSALTFLFVWLIAFRPLTDAELRQLIEALRSKEKTQ